MVSRGARCPRSALGLNLCVNRGRIPVVSRGARCPRSALGLNLCVNRGRISVVSRGARCPRSALGLNLCVNRGRIPVVSRGARCPRSALGLNLCVNRGRIPVVSRGARCPRSALAKTAVLRTASFSFALTSARLRCAMCRHVKRDRDVSRWYRAGRDAPVRHSQKQPCYAPPLFHSLPHLHACGVRCVGRCMPDRNNTNQPRSNSFRRFCTAESCQYVYYCLRSARATSSENLLL